LAASGQVLILLRKRAGLIAFVIGDALMELPLSTDGRGIGGYCDGSG
jgi:hypothetical protein